MLHVSGILENAADVAPDAVAATLDDDVADVRRDRTGRATDRARAARAGYRPGRPGALVGRHLARGDHRLRGRRPRSARCSRRSTPALRSKRSRRSRSTPRPAVVLGGAGYDGARPAQLAARLGIPFVTSTEPRRSHARGARPTVGRSRRARPARHLLHQREHRPAQGRRAVAPRQLAAHVRGRARPQPGRRRHRVHVPAVPHGGLDDRARRVAGAPGRALRARPRRGDAARRPRQRHRAARLYCIPAVWGRILEHGVGGLRPVVTRARPTPARRRLRPSCSPRSRTRSRTP